MNKLYHLKQFQDILKDYEPNARALRVLREAKLILLVGSASSGRNTVIREMVERGKYYYIISDTTRQPRVNDGVIEQNGSVYWFRTEAEMLEDLRAGEFAEAAIVHKQQVSGISIREIQVALVKRRVPVADVEVRGAATIHRLHPNAMCIFVLPPGYEEWQRRLKHRGVMANDEYERRMASAKRELKTALKTGYYHFVVNENYKETVQVIDRLFDGDFQQSLRSKARSVAEHILEELEERHPD